MTGCPMERGFVAQWFDGQWLGCCDKRAMSMK